jgi:hypothetical protein
MWCQNDTQEILQMAKRTQSHVKTTDRLSLVFFLVCFLGAPWCRDSQMKRAGQKTGGTNKSSAILQQLPGWGGVDFFVGRDFWSVFVVASKITKQIMSNI